MDSIQIFIFSWNTQSIRYNLPLGPQENFIKELIKKINRQDLVVIGLQEDAMNGSPLLNDDTSLLITAMKKYDYDFLKLISLPGWGVTTYKALKDSWDYRPRGLRLAIFKNVNSRLTITDIKAKELVCPSFCDWVTSGKGAVAISFNTNIGILTFMNTHLPFSSRSLIRNTSDFTKRHSAVMWQAKCLRYLYNKVLDLYNPDYLFVLGDLNFRVQVRYESDAQEIAHNLFNKANYIEELINEADELRLLIGYTKSRMNDNDNGDCEYLLPILLEGIDNKGPQFLPTCKLKQGRDDINICKENSYKLGYVNQRTPSWCDRILFNTFNSNINVKCNMYERWEHGTMNLSDHAAVIGSFNLYK